MKKVIRANKSLGSDISDYQKWVDFDMKKYGKISDTTMQDIKKAGLSVVKDQYGDYEVIAKEEKHNDIQESLDNLSLDTGDQVIDVTTKPISKSGEMIEPLDDTDVEEIEENSTEKDEEPVEEESSEEEVEEVSEEPAEEDITEVDEEELDTKVESYLKNKYSNVKSYITECIKSQGNKLIVEGTIRFNNNHTKQTSFIFEAKTIDKRHRVVFEGYNTHMGTNFNLSGEVLNEKLSRITLQEKSIFTPKRVNKKVSQQDIDKAEQEMNKSKKTSGRYQDTLNKYNDDEEYKNTYQGQYYDTVKKKNKKDNEYYDNQDEYSKIVKQKQKDDKAVKKAVALKNFFSPKDKKYNTLANSYVANSISAGDPSLSEEDRKNADYKANKALKELSKYNQSLDDLDYKIEKGIKEAEKSYQAVQKSKKR